MYVSVKIIIMSHLSDIQCNPTAEGNNDSLNFVKYLLLQYTDTSIEIDPDIIYTIFKALKK